MTALLARPLQIGPLTVDPPVVLAPMAGVTDAAYRRLCRSYGAGLYVSEMITARAPSACALANTRSLWALPPAASPSSTLQT